MEKQDIPGYVFIGITLFLVGVGAILAIRDLLHLLFGI